MNFYKNLIVLFIICELGVKVYAQHDPQFTQYMYNTMTVNPAYAGTKGYSVLTLLGRTQWLGFEGAPDTQTLSFDTHVLGVRGLGVGINVMNDRIGPTREISADANISYGIDVSDDGVLAFGLKGGARFFQLDREKMNPKEDTDVELRDDLNKTFPTIGAGLYYYTDKYYLGVAVPNMLPNEHYKQTVEGDDMSTDRFHFFTIAGYVFDVNHHLKFKPSVLLKSVSGAPVSLDVSANVLIKNKIHVGLAWRWDDAISALLGFQLSDKFHIGYTYDLTTSSYRVTNSGSHELLLKYTFLRPDIIISPRFF